MFQRTLLVIVVLVFFPTPATAFEYHPFPTLPTATMYEHKFVVGLLETCTVLTKGAALQMTDTCAQTVAKVPAPRTLAEQVEQAYRLPKTDSPEAASPSCGLGRSSAAEVARYAEDLRPICVKLRAEPAGALSDDDLAMLRKARDAPGALALIVNWSDAGLEKAVNRGNTYAGGPLGGLPSVGTLSDQLVRGLGEFLVKRGQAEALRYLRKQLKKELCDEDTFRREAFSSVCAAIDNLDDSASLEAIGNYLRSAAEKDLRKLPDLLLQYFGERDPAKYGELGFGARLGIAYFGAVRNGRDPLEVLYSLGELDPLDCETKRQCADVAHSVRFASAVAYTLRQGGADWMEVFNPETLRAIDRPVAATALLLLIEKRIDLLTQQGKGNLGIAFDEKLYKKLVGAPLELVNGTMSLVENWQSLQKRLKGELSDDERRQILAAAMEESVKSAMRIVEALDRLLHAQSRPAVIAASRWAGSFAAIAADLVRREYGSAISAVLGELPKLPDAREAGKTSPVKYLPLIVEIASAKSSNEVAAAFDAYAAPVGSAELKYKKSLLTINGYLGVLGGVEQMKSEGVQGFGGIVAAFAPIGLHYSAPFCNESFHVGVMLSLIDLGALTTMRANEAPEGDLDGADEGTEPDASTTPEIGLEQVFSPGLNLVLGLGGIPLVLGGGVSFAPELREVRQDGLTSAVSVLRYGGFLAVDIPIVPLN